ncbi:MAG: hypothetical protein IPG96_15385 [Proteobacteria bacterium]|nr:hypothetical protein [Pseudomonadota bacterium]
MSGLREAYFEADFLRCLGMLQRPDLSFERFLERGAGASASTAGVFAAGCAHGADNVELARQLLARLFNHELDVTATLRLMRPDFQRLAEEVRRGFRTQRRVTWLVRTVPVAAEASVDGGVRRCSPTPCSVDVLPGQHVVVLRRLGYAARAVWHDSSAGTIVNASLDEAARPEATEQLVDALARGADPGRPELGRLAATAYGASVVVLAWRGKRAGHAALFDRHVGRVVSRVSVVDPKRTSSAASADKAVRAAIDEWRGSTMPPPVYKRPLFWGAVVGAAAATGTIVYLLLRSAQPEYEMVFP